MSLFSRLANSLSSDVLKLKFDGRHLRQQKGRLPSRVFREIQALLREHDCQPGHLSVRKNGRIAFSKSIDPSLHQHLRNLLQTS